MAVVGPAEVEHSQWRWVVEAAYGPPARFRCRAEQSTRAIVTSELLSIG